MKDESTDHDTKDPGDDATMMAGDIALPQAVSRAKASLVVLTGWEIGREIELEEFPHVLGRSDLADTYVNAASVSRSHARIAVVSDGDQEFFELQDLNSSNGTEVNGVPITSARLAQGDRIRMGDVLFKFLLEDEIDSRFHQQVHRLINYDQLTGLLTMETFRQRLDFAIRRGGAGEPFSLAMTDLDGLKRVNDTFGHLAGRMIVREMGTMMREALRPQDEAGLYGGDEAIVLYPGTPLEEAKAVAEALRRTIEARVFEHRGDSFQVTISQGLAEYPKHGKTAEALIAAADRALYEAKNAGRNCVCLAE